ncbi:MAG: hypothetical protein P1R58_06570 [bacterium]|nr:hypothetical protein [bacterium]
MKYFLNSLIVVVGAFLGVYIGVQLFSDTDKPLVVVDRSEASGFPADCKLTFDVGDLFPLEDCYKLNGDTTNFEELLGTVPTLLIFAGDGCPPCDSFLAVWTGIEDKVKPDCRRIFYLPIEQQKTFGSKFSFVAPEDLYFIQTDLFVQKYNLDYYPTLVSVDRSGFVSHIQYGFAGRIDKAIITEFTDVSLE